MAVLLLAMLPVAVALAAKAPVDLSGTTLAFNAKAQLKLKKLGSFKGVDNLLLYFGPNTNEQLGYDQFEIKDTTAGTKFIGLWSDPKANGKVVLEGDQFNLETALVFVVSDVLEGTYTTVTNVHVSITKLKQKCKVKPGKGAKLSIKAAFTVTATVDGTAVESKGAYALNGKGIQPA